MANTNPLPQWLSQYGPVEEDLKGLPCWGLSRNGPHGYKKFTGLITKRGRTYITTDLFRNARFMVKDMSTPYLIDADSNGLVDKLFLFEEDMEEFLLQDELSEKLKDNLSRYLSASPAVKIQAAIAVFEQADPHDCKVILQRLRQKTK